MNKIRIKILKDLICQSTRRQLTDTEKSIIKKYKLTKSLKKHNKKVSKLYHSQWKEHEKRIKNEYRPERTIPIPKLPVILPYYE